MEPFRVILLALAAAAVCSLDVRVATFNIERLGDGKLEKPEVVEILLQRYINFLNFSIPLGTPSLRMIQVSSYFFTRWQILDDYDLVCIQELTDEDGSSVPVLLGLLNEASGKEYTNHTSPRLGRTTYKEQYLFLYEPSLFQVVETILYDDTADDIFEREPYYVTFRSGNYMFTMGTIHVKPDDALAELIQFAPANDWVTENYGMQEFLLLGDFNADCDYVSGSDWDEIGLWTQPGYRWFVDNDADTTVNSNTDCAYSRVVAKGPDLQARISDVRVRRFDEEFGLEQAEALDVSDHYPVEFTLTV
ncbi:unnamed protein product [Darwinula stevensoni]|uniref:Deoxyribonuclease n=1 Tax=Darwinula stevensoni TaxID=69355 RepID=A0A7R9AHI7_9CRUS|nr:unnamed protein product [Darwinula stevensoni]CAG0904438.1 unnamed protein product [Darwinula stevensoni]